MVNTIPAPVLTEPVLAALRPGSLIVDLASKPGGTDFAAAQRLGHRAIHALSLPAACAPETAGEAVARTVCAILAEREGSTMTKAIAQDVAFAVCGSFCTLGAAVAQPEQLTRQGWELLPVMSFAASGRTPALARALVEGTAGDPYRPHGAGYPAGRGAAGPPTAGQALVVAPCTGATLARLAAGLSDTPVTLAAKSLLRVGCPVLLAVSTNDGLGASGENIARLFQRKHYYFVPYGQDDLQRRNPRA